eukprot:880854_1
MNECATTTDDTTDSLSNSDIISHKLLDVLYSILVKKYCSLYHLSLSVNILNKSETLSITSTAIKHKRYECLSLLILQTNTKSGAIRIPIDSKWADNIWIVFLKHNTSISR